MVVFLAGICFGIALGTGSAAYFLERAHRRDLRAAWDAVDYERNKRSEERGEAASRAHNPTRELARAIDEFNRRSL